VILRIIQVVVVLLLLLLVYLWIPEESIGSRKKRRRALERAFSSPELHNAPAHDNPQPGTHSRKPATHNWKHGRIQSFHESYIEPHRRVLERGGYLRSIEMILGLLDSYGDCPSVVNIDADREYQKLRNVYDLLSGVTLLDHSLNVSERMIENFKKAKTRDIEMLLGKVLVTALGHDIGKIPELIEIQKYAKGDHPYISYLVMKKVILKGDSQQRDDILTAIREHHYPVQEGFTYELRKADQEAREMETEELAVKGEATPELIRLVQEQKLSDSVSPGQASASRVEPPKPQELSWLDLDEFLTLVEDHVNVSEDGIHFSAFSMKNGLVYLTLDLVSDIVFELAKKHNHPEVLVGSDTKEKKRSIEYAVKKMLVERGFIPSFIGEGYTGARFAVYKNGKRTIGFYLPLQASAFKTSLAELEARKKNVAILKEISDVKPLIRKKNNE